MKTSWKTMEIYRYKENKSCVFCGWKEHPEILQFHHPDAMVKNINLFKNGRTKAIGTLKINACRTEMPKCILLCPNCHMWHHKQNGLGHELRTRKSKPLKKSNTLLAYAD